MSAVAPGGESDGALPDVGGLTGSLHESDVASRALFLELAKGEPKAERDFADAE
jgi:hypothetical protein